MKKLIQTISISFIALSLLIASIAFAAKKDADERVIIIAGLVVNAESLSPIEAANIYDADNNLMGSTDKNGYYKVAFKYHKAGELIFKLKVVKQGYAIFYQHEHWGNLSGTTTNIMYLGLQAKGSNTETFSTFADKTGVVSDLGYESVLTHFDKVRSEKVFNDKLAAAKAGNQNAVVKIDNDFYIVDKTGWIKLNSDKDRIAINHQKVYTASEINTFVKRKDIKGMTPVTGKDYAFVVFTK